MSALAIPAPSSLPDVYTLCEQIQRDMVQIHDVGTLKETAVKLGAFDQYLSRTSIEGRKQIQETMRRLEARCGWLLGEAVKGAHSSANEGAQLTPNERSDFRAMAANPDIVDEVIAASTDESPPSRSKILDAIKTKRPKPTVDEVLAQERADALKRRAARLEQFITGWIEFEHFGTHPDRDEVLNLLNDHDRQTLLRIEREITWTTRAA